VPFTLVHAGKYTTEDKLKIQIIQKLNTKANNTKHSKTKLPGLVNFYDIQSGNKVGLILQCSRAHTNNINKSVIGRHANKRVSVL